MDVCQASSRQTDKETEIDTERRPRRHEEKAIVGGWVREGGSEEGSVWAGSPSAMAGALACARGVAGGVET